MAGAFLVGQTQKNTGDKQPMSKCKLRVLKDCSEPISTQWALVQTRSTY